MPEWAREALAPASFAFLDLLLAVARAFPAYTVEALLDTPVRRFWLMVDEVRRHNLQRTQAAQQNPMAALALYGDR